MFFGLFRRRAIDLTMMGPESLAVLGARTEKRPPITGVCPMCLAMFERPADSKNPELCTRHSLLVSGITSNVVPFHRPPARAVSPGRRGWQIVPGGIA